MISTGLWNKLNRNYPLRNVTTKYIAAYGEVLNVQGASKLPVQVGGLDVMQKFIIMKKICLMFYSNMIFYN